MDKYEENEFHDEDFDENDYEYDDDSGSFLGTAAGLITAAAVGAGVALLFSTETGKETRERVVKGVRDFDIPEKARYVREAAHDGYEYVRRGGRPKKKSHGMLYTILGTVASAAVAAALSPETTKRAGRWVGETARDVKRSASTRWEDYRGREDRMSSSTADAIRRLEEDAEMDPATPGAAPVRRRTRTPASASTTRGSGARPERTASTPEAPDVA